MLDVRRRALIGCSMSQEKSDWYSRDATLFYSGSLWWPLCRQWQHLRQCHGITCACMHTEINTHKHMSTHTYIHTYKLTYMPKHSEHFNSTHASTYSQLVKTSLTLSFSHSHTAPCHCPRPVVYGLEHYILCWRLQCVCDCWRLMPLCLHAAGVHAWTGGPGCGRTVCILKKWDCVQYVWFLTLPNTLLK